MLRQALEGGGIEFVLGESANENAKVTAVSLDDGSVVRLETEARS